MESPKPLSFLSTPYMSAGGLSARDFYEVYQRSSQQRKASLGSSCRDEHHKQKILYSLLSQSPDGISFEMEQQRSNSFSHPIHSVSAAESSQYIRIVEPVARETNLSSNSKLMDDNMGSSEFLQVTHRPRSKSMGSSCESSASSYESSISGDSASAESPSRTAPTLDEAEMLAVACSRLNSLGLKNMSYSPPRTEYMSISQPDSPKSCSEIRRKYSEGSRSHLKSKSRSVRQTDDRRACHTPIDLSVKRVKCSGDYQPERDVADESHSILKSVLSGRNRSHSMSVGMAGRYRTSNVLADASSELNSLIQAGIETRYLPNQKVTLAKKNLQPINARVLSWLTKHIDFALSVPVFASMSFVEQVRCLTQSCPRLLLLDMAETNFHFVVTAVREEHVGGEMAAGDVTLPTMQFVEGVQNFVKKCQSITIGSEEYYYMKMITLFHAGKEHAVGHGSVTEQVNSLARSSLQEVVRRRYPDERLRYSTLLLTLHTLFSINDTMVQALFCRQLLKHGLEAFIADELCNRFQDTANIER